MHAPQTPKIGMIYLDRWMSHNAPKMSASTALLTMLMPLPALAQPTPSAAAVCTSRLAGPARLVHLSCHYRGLRRSVFCTRCCSSASRPSLWMVPGRCAVGGIRSHSSGRKRSGAASGQYAAQKDRARCKLQPIDRAGRHACYPGLVHRLWRVHLVGLRRNWMRAILRQRGPEIHARWHNFLRTLRCQQGRRRRLRKLISPNPRRPRRDGHSTGP